MISMNIYASVDNPKLARANKLRVDTGYSQDGRSTESFYVSYDPKDTLALFLFEKTLALSSFVVMYSVYDAEGNIDKDFVKEQHPKRH